MSNGSALKSLRFSADVMNRMPVPLALHYREIHVALRRTEMDVFRATRLVMSMAELYLQFGVFYALASLLASGIRPQPKTQSQIRLLHDKPMAMGDWHSLWHHLAREFDTDASRPHFHAGIHTVLHGGSSELAKTIQSWTPFRNDDSHLSARRPQELESLLESTLPGLEKVLHGSSFLLETAPVLVNHKTQLSGGGFEYEAWPMSGTQPMCRLVESPCNLSAGHVYLFHSRDLPDDVGSLAGDTPHLPLTPFLVPARSARPGDEPALAVFQSIKKTSKDRVAVYQDISSTNTEPWSDPQRLGEIQDLLAGVTRMPSPNLRPQFDLQSCRDVGHDIRVVAQSEHGHWDAKNFFAGHGATWQDLMLAHDIPRDVVERSSGSRMAYRDFFQRCVGGAIDEARKGLVPQLMIFGPGGSGKSTLLRRIALDLCQEHDDVFVVATIRHRQPRFDELRQIALDTGKPLVIMVDQAADLREVLRDLRDDFFRLRRGLVVLCAEQEARWSRHDLPRDALHRDAYFELEDLSQAEVAALRDALERHQCLGVLAGEPVERQLSVLNEYARRQLLVGLREATEGKPFEMIIRNEYEHLPSEQGRELYRRIALAESKGLAIPGNVLLEMTSLKRRDIRTACARILVTTEAYGANQFTFLTRHAEIAGILSQLAYEREGRFDGEQFLDDILVLVNTLGDHLADAKYRKPLASCIRQLIDDERVPRALATEGVDPKYLSGIVQAVLALDRSSGVRVLEAMVRKWDDVSRTCDPDERSRIEHCVLDLMDRAIAGSSTKERARRYTAVLLTLAGRSGVPAYVAKSLDRLVEQVELAPPAEIDQPLLKLATLCQKHGGRQDVERVIEVFERVVSEPQLDPPPQMCRLVLGLTELYLRRNATKKLDLELSIGGASNRVKLQFAVTDFDRAISLIETMLRSTSYPGERPPLTVRLAQLHAAKATPAGIAAALQLLSAELDQREAEHDRILLLLGRADVALSGADEPVLRDTARQLLAVYRGGAPFQARKVRRAILALAGEIVRRRDGNALRTWITLDKATIARFRQMLARQILQPQPAENARQVVDELSQVLGPHRNDESDARLVQTIAGYFACQDSQENREIAIYLIDVLRHATARPLQLNASWSRLVSAFWRQTQAARQFDFDRLLGKVVDWCGDGAGAQLLRASTAITRHSPPFTPAVASELLSRALRIPALAASSWDIAVRLGFIAESQGTGRELDRVMAILRELASTETDAAHVGYLLVRHSYLARRRNLHIGPELEHLLRRAVASPLGLRKLFRARDRFFHDDCEESIQLLRDYVNSAAGEDLIPRRHLASAFAVRCADRNVELVVRTRISYAWMEELYGRLQEVAQSYGIDFAAAPAWENPFLAAAISSLEEATSNGKSLTCKAAVRLVRLYRQRGLADDEDRSVEMALSTLQELDPPADRLQMLEELVDLLCRRRRSGDLEFARCALRLVRWSSGGRQDEFRLLCLLGDITLAESADASGAFAETMVQRLKQWEAYGAQVVANAITLTKAMEWRLARRGTGPYLDAAIALLTRLRDEPAFRDSEPLLVRLTQLLQRRRRAGDRRLAIQWLQEFLGTAGVPSPDAVVRLAELLDQEGEAPEKVTALLQTVVDEDAPRVESSHAVFMLAESWAASPEASELPRAIALLEKAADWPLCPGGMAEGGPFPTEGYSGRSTHAKARARRRRSQSARRIEPRVRARQLLCQLLFRQGLADDRERVIELIGETGRLPPR